MQATRNVRQESNWMSERIKLDIVEAGTFLYGLTINEISYIPTYTIWKSFIVNGYKKIKFVYILAILSLFFYSGCMYFRAYYFWDWYTIVWTWEQNHFCQYYDREGGEVIVILVYPNITICLHPAACLFYQQQQK